MSNSVKESSFTQHSPYANELMDGRRAALRFESALLFRPLQRIYVQFTSYSQHHDINRKNCGLGAFASETVFLFARKMLILRHKTQR